MRPNAKLDLNAMIGRAQFGAAVFVLCTALACSSSSNAEEAAKQEAREKQRQKQMDEQMKKLKPGNENTGTEATTQDENFNFKTLWKRVKGAQ